jgi:site-specific recombinase XerD
MTPPVSFLSGPQASRRFWEFFTANIRNLNTRRAYCKAAVRFSEWCASVGILDLSDVRPMHVAAYIEDLQLRIAAPSVKLQLAAIRMLFDWLVVGQIVPTNPASVVRGPKHVVKKSKTPVLSAEESRALRDAIDTSKLVGLRDRARVALLVYTFARVGAARIFTRKATGHGSASTRKAASVTRCLAITSLKCFFRSTLPRLE